MWEEAWFSISIREITFREQELNWLFAKYKRLENNPLYGSYLVPLLVIAELRLASLVILTVCYQGRIREEGMQLTISPTCEQKLNSIYL